MGKKNFLDPVSVTPGTVPKAMARYFSFRNKTETAFGCHRAKAKYFQITQNSTRKQT